MDQERRQEAALPIPLAGSLFYCGANSKTQACKFLASHSNIIPQGVIIQEKGFW